MAPFMKDQSPPTSSAGDSTPPSESSELDGNGTEPIAIIGFSFKFPDDADTPEGFWEMLMEQRNAARDFPADRINVNGHYRKENRHNSLPMRGGNFLKDGISDFDADFFSISPTEANALDPMQQKLLEVSYHAFENAGIPIETVVQSETSVYTGCFTHDYLIQTSKDGDDLPTYGAYGVGAAMLANRISHFYNLMGPSIAVDSACSSSAMALDMAVQSLRTQSSSMSLVAGCNLTFGPETFAMLSNLNMLSKDNRSYSFDSRANGYARGEGIAVMLVKRLDDAIRDGNIIRAVIRATGANEDGRTPGITQPSQAAQQLLIEQTYRKAGLSKSLTRYCEAHGTGTPLGDPLESTAIGNCFRDFRSDAEPMLLGSVKSNIGHTEGASGLAGVIKAVFALENGIIPPNADFREINPRIDTHHLRVKIPTEPTPWPTPGLRRASINSFGYGGANCHIVVDDAYNFMRLRGIDGKHNTAARPNEAYIPQIESTTDTTSSEITPKLVVLSTSDEAGVERLVTSYGPYLSKKIFGGVADDAFFNSLVYTLDSHRSRLPHRVSMVAHSAEDLMELGSALPTPIKARSSALKLGFVFTGQGAQWNAMGRELLSYPIYRESIEEATAHLNLLGCPWSAKDELMRSKETSKIDDPEYSQTLCTVVQVALVDLLDRINITPIAVVGHSSGEIGAAYAGRYISRQTAWKVAYQRGVLASKLTKSTEHGAGAMMAVGLAEEEVLPFISEVLAQEQASIGLRVACVNSPKNTTVAGDEHLIDVLNALLNAQDTGIFARKLRVQVAYHSPQMQAVAKDYLESLGSMLKGPPTTETIPMISSVTGKLVASKEVCNPSYWVDNMVSPVLFSPAVMEMCGTGSDVDRLVEIGPHSALEGPLREILKSSGMKSDIGYNSILLRNRPATTTFLQAAGDLWCENYPVNIRLANELASDQPVPRSMLIDLPSYAFDHTHTYWHESRLSKAYRLREHLPHDFLGSRCLDWSPLDARWRLLIRVRELPWIADHIVDGRKIYPGTGMLVMVIQAAKELADPLRTVSGFSMRDIDFSSAMELEGLTETLEVITSLRPRNGAAKDSSLFDFRIISCTNPVNDEWIKNIHGSIEIEYEEVEDWHADQKARLTEKLTKQHQHSVKACTEPVDDAFMYKRLKTWGLDYGPSFRLAKEQFVSTQQEAVSEILTLRNDEEELQPHVIHPVTLDAIGHLCFTAFSAGGTKSIATAMPSTIDYLWIAPSGLSAPQANSIHTCSKVVKRTPRGFVAEITGVNPEKTSELRVYIQGCTMAFISDVRKDSGDMQDLPNPDQQWFNVVRKVDLTMLGWKEAEKYLVQQCGEKAEPLDLACKYIELAAHQKPELKVLQLGTSEETPRILDAALDGEKAGSLTCATYDIVDDDEETLAAAKDAFVQYGDKIHYYDASATQLKSSSYDLIIASQNGGTEPELNTTLDKAKSVIGQEGVLLLLLPLMESALLEEFSRKHRLNMAVLTSQSQDSSKNSLVICTATAQTNSAPVDQKVRVFVAGNYKDERHTTIVNELELDNSRFEIVRTSLVEASKNPELNSSILILLSDPDHLCLSSMTPESFSALQEIMSTETKILWVSDKSAEKSIGGSPVSTIMEGSARSLRMENNNLTLVLLTLQSFEGKSGKHIKAVLDKIASHEVGSNYEQDYFEHDGHLHTDRIINSNQLKEAANTRLTAQYKETVNVGDCADFKLEITQFSQLDTLRFVEAPVAQEKLSARSIDIQVNAVSIELRDHKKAMGKGKNPKPQFGHACAGLVVGADVDGTVRKGDRVFAMVKNSFQSRVRALESHTLKLPDTIDFARACAKIPALAAAHYALTEVGRWRKGDAVLVYPCTGFVGEAAIQVCQQLKAEVFATVHSEEQSTRISGRFQVPASHIYPHQKFYNSRDPGFQGADVVLCLEPPQNHHDWTFINKFGRVIYAPSISGSPSFLPALHLPANISYGLLDLSQVVEERPHLLEDSLRCATDILSASGEEEKPATFLASEIVPAFQHVSDVNNQAVVVFDPKDEIVLTRNTKSTLHLDPNATYVISGGTGGIGRSMARWCTGRGARHLILLSRSGATSGAAQNLVSSLTAQGVHVEAPVCDTVNENTLSTVIQDCLLRMPPIRGCFQASGAYKDLTFDKYDLEGWDTAMKSKAISSWNLHKVLPSGMDFFIMLSSVSTVLGPISMSSYAGANSYQDGLARYRLSIGEKATAMSPGVLHDIGFVTEFTDAQRERLHRVGYFVPTWEPEIFAMLDIYCDPNCSMINEKEYRPIFGINGTAQLAANGSDVPFTFTQPLWQHTLYTDVITKNASAKAQDDDVKVIIKNASSPGEATGIATGALRKQLAVLLSTQEERLQDGASVDSLVAIELRNWLGKTFDADIPVFEIVSASTWSSIGESIAEQVRNAE
ncbi:ketoacyl-synt-domain-containing protein [Periconia macrospinosa]|uniref:Ketoacyl-synt-domain-containing protein n=1 Tax=Periconia macrospinosa TaxID=97972 RepID=A0A2V1D5G9_9PLEO|nr:ketoacyl-synt-domain-containing protein [Periconia macrospinosa]